MVTFVGAGSGAPDLITVRGAKVLAEADVIIYAGSLVNPALLDYKKEGCAVWNSAKMTLEEVFAVMREAEAEVIRSCTDLFFSFLTPVPRLPAPSDTDRGTCGRRIRQRLSPGDGCSVRYRSLQECDPAASGIRRLDRRA